MDDWELVTTVTEDWFGCKPPDCRRWLLLDRAQDGNLVVLLWARRRTERS